MVKIKQVTTFSLSNVNKRVSLLDNNPKKAFIEVEREIGIIVCKNTIEGMNNTSTTNDFDVQIVLIVEFGV